MKTADPIVHIMNAPSRISGNYPNNNHETFSTEKNLGLMTLHGIISEPVIKYAVLYAENERLAFLIISHEAVLHKILK